MTYLRTIRSAIKVMGIMFGAATLIAGTVTPVRAQAFAERKAALVDYSKADMEPSKACETLSGFKSKEIAKSKRR